MYLDVIESAVTTYPKDYPQRKNNPNMKTDKLNISDIQDAHPMSAFKTTQRKTYIYEAEDVNKDIPKMNGPKFQGPEGRPPKEEIEYSHPIAVGFKTKRQLNPLAPNYKLPSFKQEPEPVTKLLRETNKLSDIEGAAPSNPKIIGQNDQKKSIKDHDFLTKYTDPELVQKCSAYGQPLRKRVGKVFFDNQTDNFYLKRTTLEKDQFNYVDKTKEGYEIYNTLKVKDINNDRVFHTLRSTNPLQPKYVYDIPPNVKGDGKLPNEWLIGDIPNSSPSTTLPYLKKPPSTSLMVKDINNDTTGLYAGKLKTKPINPGEIEGAKKGHFTTFFKSSMRHTHPLNPSY